jgi:tRNA 2-selenouridine synthase
VLEGGYKVFRNWVLDQFEIADRFKVVGGYTGSGKTLIIHALQRAGKAIIDLEALAHHKGSAFGALGEAPQPKQEMFENLLALELDTKRKTPQAIDGIWLEDESQRIGNLQIPIALWHTIRKSPVYFLDIPFEERLAYITEHYGKFAQADLINAVLRIQKRLGGLETKNSIQYFLENKPAESFRILLTYYDKWYIKGLHNRENLSSVLNKIPCTGVDTETKTQNLLACITASTL